MHWNVKQKWSFSFVKFVKLIPAFFLWRAGYRFLKKKKEGETKELTRLACRLDTCSEIFCRQLEVTRLVVTRQKEATSQKNDSVIIIIIMQSFIYCMIAYKKSYIFWQIQSPIIFFLVASKIPKNKVFLLNPFAFYLFCYTDIGI